MRLEFFAYKKKKKKHKIIIFRLSIRILDADPSHQFLQKENRELLHSLTNMRVRNVFQVRPKPFERPKYAYYSAEYMKKKLKSALLSTKSLLLMPPVMQIEEDDSKLLAQNPEMQGYNDSTYLFIDSTIGLKDRDRLICVRTPEGDLRMADQLTRRRMIQTYFPSKGRHLIVPRMFTGEHLQRVLNEGKYEFLLNRAIIQFEPYERDYHRVTSITYQHINKTGEFEILRSTRHFGPLAFFLAWHKLIDNLVIDCIRRDYLRNAVEIICLMYNLNRIPYDKYILLQLERYPKRDDEYFYRELIAKTDLDVGLNIENSVGKNQDDLKCDEICLQFLDEFVASENVTKANDIKATLQTYREYAEEKRRLLDGLEKAHGIS